MGHLAVTDVAGGRFRAFERFSREAVGLAGVASEPFAVWLEDWRIDGDFDGLSRLVARADGWGVELELEATQPVVLQGDRGLSSKGSAPGNASYYYSLPGLATRGTLFVDGEEIVASGTSWLDREWSTSALDEGVVGWDWFALQFDDERELMVYILRRADGSADRMSSGSVVAVDGSSRTLAADEVRIEVLDHWTSDASGARYPSRWRLEIASESLSLDVRPLLADQEHRESVVYWEGAVEAEGTRNGRPVSGLGYVELTGYAGPAVARTTR